MGGGRKSVRNTLVCLLREKRTAINNHNSAKDAALSRYRAFRSRRDDSGISANEAMISGMHIRRLNARKGRQ